MKYYYGNETGQIPGAFPDKWWEGSALFMVLLQYWHWTGDTTYNEELSIGMEHQSGDNGDYMPSNYSSYLVRATPSRPPRHSIYNHSNLRIYRETMTSLFGDLQR